MGGTSSMGEGKKIEQLRDKKLVEIK